MDNKIKLALANFHEYNDEARKYFKAHQLVVGQPLQVHTEVDLMLYAKWRTKADIELNEFHTLIAQNNPGKLPYSLEQLYNEKAEFKSKLNQTQNWLTQHYT